MLKRPDIGSREHILLWLAGKPPGDSFVWHKAHKCACGQYSQEFLGDAMTWVHDDFYGRGSPALMQMNIAASSHRTFGALYAALRDRWS